MLSESNERLNDTKNLSSSEESLQKYLKIKKHSFISRLVVFLALWGIIIGYFVSPLSKVGNPNIDGNRYLTNQDIIEISKLDSSLYLWENNTKEQVSLLSNHPLIKNVEITVNVFGVYIEVEETYPMAKVKSSTSGNDLADFDYYLSDKTLVKGEAVFQSEPLTKAIRSMQRLPLLTNVNNEEMLKMVLTQLSEIDLEVVNKIKEIKYVDDYLASDEIVVLKILIDKAYLNLDGDLILYIDMNRMSYKISKSHLEIIAKYIKPSAKIDDSNYCLSYISNKTASCKESVK